jgi:UDPglucose 6-dehydrogenase
MKQKTKVAIIGMGFLGQLMKQFFEKRADLFDVYGYDVNGDLWCNYFPIPKHPDRMFFGSADHEEFRKFINKHCKYAFVCVPTPPTEDERCDTSIVEECCDWLNTEFIVIRSTVEPGTTKRLQDAPRYESSRLLHCDSKKLIFWPEFGGESKYQSPYAFDKDVSQMPWFIFGAAQKDWAKELLQLILPIAGPMTRYHLTDATTAEMAKYTTNVFAAMKITYCNEIFEICQSLGINYEEVREMWANSDPRVSLMHTAVFKGNRGYGGKCFPKDVLALSQFAQNELELDLPVLQNIDASNDNFRKMNND